MTKAAITIWILGLLVVVHNFIASYLLGYTETKTALLAANRFLAWGAELFLFTVLLLITLSVFIFGRNSARFWVVTAFLGFWPGVFLMLFLIGSVFGLDENFIMCGLRDRLIHEYTLNGLRAVASDVKAYGILKKPFSNDYFGLTQITPSQKVAFDILSKKYPFLFRGYDRNEFQAEIDYDEKTNSVVFTWITQEAGLEYWGVAISMSGMNPITDEEAHEKPMNPEEVLRPTNDIVCFYYDGLLD